PRCPRQHHLFPSEPHRQAHRPRPAQLCRHRAPLDDAPPPGDPESGGHQSLSSAACGGGLRRGKLGFFSVIGGQRRRRLPPPYPPPQANPQAGERKEPRLREPQTYVSTTSMLKPPSLSQCTNTMMIGSLFRSDR